MSLKKIAFISHSCIESSSRTKLKYLSQYADLRLITPSWYPTPFGRFDVDFDFNPTVRVRSYPISFLHIKQTSTRWFFRSRDLDFPQFQPDIVHVENEHHSWIVCQALLYRKLFVPHAKLVVFSWDNLLPHELGLTEKTLERLARLNRKRVDFFITGNRGARDILLAKGVPSDKVEVIPQFGIDPDIFFPFSEQKRQSCRQVLGIKEEEFVVGYVGKLIEEKGLFDLVDATNQLRSLLRDRLVLMLMGTGYLEESLRSKCSRLGLRLVLVPARKNDRVAEAMNVMDVLVLPTHTKPPIKEQFGRVLIEAMACGIPVIGSDCGEIPNVIGDAGLVFREHDWEQLSQCLRLCYENRDFRLGLRERGLVRVSERFTNEKIAEQTLQVYERVSHTNNAKRTDSVGSMALR